MNERRELYRRALDVPEWNPEAFLAASGGLCAPLSPVYKLFSEGITSGAAVRQALPSLTVSAVAAAFDVPEDLIS